MPYYKDYIAMIQNKGKDNLTLAIDLHLRTDATLRDAILSDLSGNLAGPSTDGSTTCSGNQQV